MELFSYICKVSKNLKYKKGDLLIANGAGRAVLGIIHGKDKYEDYYNVVITGVNEVGTHYIINFPNALEWTEYPFTFVKYIETNYDLDVKSKRIVILSDILSLPS